MKGKVFLICGKICSGKSFYAERLKKEKNAVVLSVDEITLALFDAYIGERHDEICEKTQKYLYGKSLEIVETGCSVILDWGFWQRDKRDYARRFYESRGIVCEFYYIEISDELWKINIAERNRAVTEGKVSAYYVDDELAEKVDALFEPPVGSEIDVKYFNERFTVKAMTADELPMLSEMFEYNNFGEALSENVLGIENGKISIFGLTGGNKFLGELHVKYESEDIREAVKGRRAYLYAFRIHKDYRGLGMGKYLLQAVINALEKQGYGEFTVGVEDDNACAEHIYRSFGFTEKIARKSETYQGDSYEYNLLLKNRADFSDIKIRGGNNGL